MPASLVMPVSEYEPLSPISNVASTGLPGSRRERSIPSGGIRLMSVADSRMSSAEILQAARVGARPLDDPLEVDRADRLSLDGDALLFRESPMARGRR